MERGVGDLLDHTHKHTYSIELDRRKNNPKLVVPKHRSLLNDKKTNSAIVVAGSFWSDPYSELW